jgi:Ca2+-binding RTX toxin-like protein
LIFSALTPGHAISVSANGNTVTGTNFGDSLYGSEFDDTLNGGEGDDRLYSIAFHNGGVDSSNGGAGNDTFEIHDSVGIFDGGIGNDTFEIDRSAGTINGGAGTDTVVSDSLGTASFSNVEILDVKAISANIFASIAQLSSFATVTNSEGPGSLIVFQLSGTGGTIDFSTLLTAGHSIIVVNNGVTSGYTVTGSNLGDLLNGTDFADTLNGSGGADELAGGLGNDIFMFNTAIGGGNIDDITDFSVADDTIRLDNAIFASIAGTGVLTAAQFVANASGTALDADDHIIYETDTGWLIYDANGSTAGGRYLVATLDAGLAITNAGFFIV